MKLAEALVLRSDGQRKIEQLKHRLEQVVKVQEDDTPGEDPHELFQELARTVDEVYVLIRKINKTNAQTWFDEQRTLADVLTERDRILTKRRVLSETLQHATTRLDRYTRMEVKYYRTIDVAALQREVDELSKTYRELDLRVQEKNWTVELLD